MEHQKQKVSVTLSPDLLRAVDHAVRSGKGGSRSAIIEHWLQRAARMELEDRLRDQTIAYYENLSAAARREDAAIALASSRAARRLRVDD